MKKKFWRRAVLAVSGMMCLIHLFGCAAPGQTTEFPDRYSLLTDPTFEKGVYFSGFASNIPEQIQIGKTNFGETDQTPEWRVDQWACQYNLFDHLEEMEAHDQKFSVSDPSKTIVFDRGRGGFSLELNSSREYADENGNLIPRKYGEPWPHLLLEQPYLYENERTARTNLKDLDSLIFVLEFQIDKAVDYRDQYAFDPSLHAGQFSVFTTLTDNVEGSESQGSGMWFGFNLFDTRYDYPPMIAHQDGGKEDATELYIYSPAMEEIYQDQGYYEEKVQVGQTYRFEIDVLPYIYRAITQAQADGFVKSLQIGNLSLSTMNIGFEHPGIVDMKVTVHELDIVAVRKK